MVEAGNVVVCLGLILLTLLHCVVSTEALKKPSPPISNSNPGCGEDSTGTKGSIASANYPYSYPDDLDCAYALTSPANTRITLNFEDFDTYNEYDYLQIRDGVDMNAELIKKCYGSSCGDITSKNNSMYIHFHTSSKDQGSGFILNWHSGLPDVNCYYCSNAFDSNHFDPVCGEDQYNGHEEKSDKWNACYTSVYYDGSHHIERGGTENPELAGFCYDSGFSITCFCQYNRCNNDLCQNCSTSPPISTTINITLSTLPQNVTTIHPSLNTTIISPNTTAILTVPTLPQNTTTTHPPPSTTFSPTLPTTKHPNTSHSPTPPGALQCYSCIACSTVDGDTPVETSEEFLTCFTAIELGNSHFVIRGGSPDSHEDGTCRHLDGMVYECYCASNRCNSEELARLLREQRSREDKENI